MKAVVYKRVSVLNKSIDGTSLEVQQERLEAYAKAQGWDVIDTYEDAGISAKDTNRPALQRMLKDAENGKFDVILVYKLDRLSRSVSDFHKLANTLDHNKVALVSVTQHLDTTSPTGRLLRNILVDFANFERELITERVVDNKTHRAAEGKWNGGHAPYGYRLINKKLETAPLEFEKAKQVYKLYLTGRQSMRQIARLTDLSFSQVELILMNPLYAGKIAWGKTKYKDHKGMFKRIPFEDWIMADGDHEAAVTYEEWLRVQEIKKGKKQIPDSRGNKQLFKDLVWCGKCGNKMYFFDNRPPYLYYRCHDINRFEGCRNCSIRQDEIEKKAVRKINDLLTDKSFWKRTDQNNVKIQQSNDALQEAKQHKNQLEKVESRISRLIKQMADTDIAHLLKPELLRLEEERKGWHQKMMKSEQEAEEWKPLDPKLMSGIMGDITSNWPTLTYEEKCEGIGLLILSLTVDEESVTMDWTDPAFPQVKFKRDQIAKNGRVLVSRY